MTSNCKKYYEKNFNREKILNNFEEIIHNIIDNKK